MVQGVRCRAHGVGSRVEGAGFGTLLNLRTTYLQKSEAVPNRARS